MLSSTAAAGQDQEPWTPDAVWANIEATASTERPRDTDLRWPLREGLDTIGTPRPGATGARCVVLRGADMSAVPAARQGLL